MRLLIVRLSAMGDIVHTLPLAKNARRAGVEVGWLVDEGSAGLLRGNPSIDRLFVARTRVWRRNPLRPATFDALATLRTELRAFSADATIEAHGLWKSAILARLSGAPVWSLRRRDRREPTSAWLIDRAVALRPEAVHVVDQNLLFLAALDIPVVDPAPDARYLLAAESAEAESFCRQLPRPYALYHPGAARPEKAWGEQRYVELARALERDRGLAPVVSWGPGDEERVARFRKLLPSAFVIPRLDAPGLARVIDGCSLFVAGDTGPAHLADALGRPTLALFGPESAPRNVPERNRPYRGWVLRYDGATSVAEVAAQASGILDAVASRE